jgi:hypothetical protein
MLRLDRTATTTKVHDATGDSEQLQQPKCVLQQVIRKAWCGTTKLCEIWSLGILRA